MSLEILAQFYLSITHHIGVNAVHHLFQSLKLSIPPKSGTFESRWKPPQVRGSLKGRSASKGRNTDMCENACHPSAMRPCANSVRSLEGVMGVRPDETKEKLYRSPSPVIPEDERLKLDDGKETTRNNRPTQSPEQYTNIRHPPANPAHSVSRGSLL